MPVILARFESKPNVWARARFDGNGMDGVVSMAGCECKNEAMDGNGTGMLQSAPDETTVVDLEAFLNISGHRSTETV